MSGEDRIDGFVVPERGIGDDPNPSPDDEEGHDRDERRELAPSQRTTRPGDRTEIRLSVAEAVEAGRLAWGRPR